MSSDPRRPAGGRESAAYGDRAREHLPLTEPAYHILLALEGGARHGYGILLEIEEQTEGRVTMRTGTLYNALRRLLGAGLLEEVAAPDHDADGDDPRRRYYATTGLGREVLAAEAERLARMVELARGRSLLGAGGRRRS